MSTVVTPWFELLVFGYVRCNIKTTNIIPSSILYLLTNFYDPFIKWEASVTSDKVKGPKVRMCGITFEIAVTETGSINHYYGQDKKHSNLRLMINNFDQMEDNLCHLLFKIQIKNDDEEISKLLALKGRYTDDDTFSHCIYDERDKNWFVARSFEMEPFILYNIIYFRFSIVLLEKKYFKMNAIQVINWKNFDKRKDIYIHDLIKITWNKSSELDEPAVIIKFLKYPFKISCMHFNLTFNNEYGRNLYCFEDEIVERDKSFDILLNNIFFIDIGSSILENTDTLTMTVTKVYDTERKEISKSDWNRYGLQF